MQFAASVTVQLVERLVSDTNSYSDSIHSTHDLKTTPAKRESFFFNRDIIINVNSENKSKQPKITTVQILHLAVILFLIFLLLAVFAILNERAVLKAQNPQKTASAPAKKPVAIKLKKHPLDYLPKEIDGYKTKMRQKFPEDRDIAAEAIYQPEDEQLSFATPVNAYVKVTFFGDERAALRDLNKRMKNYPVAASINPLDFGNTDVQAGYSEDEGELLLFWVEEGYAFFINTVFYPVVPAQKDNHLYNVTLHVFQAIREK